MLLVGNKCDEESGKREVSAKTGEALEVDLNDITLIITFVLFKYLENVESEIH